MRLLLVTGSRSAPESPVLAELGTIEPHRLTLMHGASGWTSAERPEWLPSKLNGADGHAHRWALRNDVALLPMPAQWWRDGEVDRSAGPRRNRAMVDVAARFRDAGWKVLVLAFPKKVRAESPGTWGCIDLADRAGLPVRVHEVL
jgi:hypothetical protein